MNKTLSAILLVLIATIISATIMLPSISADLTERQANEVIFQQSIRVVTLEGRLNKAMETAQDTVYDLERGERILEETAMKLQTAMVDLAKSESKLDKNVCELKVTKEALVVVEYTLERNKRSTELLRTKVKTLVKEVTNLKKKLLKRDPPV